MNNKKSHISFVILGAVLLCTIPLVAKFINDAINNGFALGMFREGYVKGIMNIDTYREFLHFSNPVNVIGLAALGYYVISYLLNRIGAFKVLEEYEQIEGYGSHGTMRWQTDEEIKDLYCGDDVGWFLGGLKKKQSYSLDIKNAAYHLVENKTDLNMQCIVIGPPGSQKTTGFVLPNIFNLPKAYKKRNNGEMPDLIITDPKPELYPLTGKYLEDCGYDIKILDFIDLTYGGSLNVLDFISDDKTLMQVAQGYIDSVDGGADGKSGGDQQFWNDQEAQVLAALMGFVKQKYPKEEQNISSVAKMLTSPEISNIDDAKYYFEDNNIEGAPKQFWNNFLMIADSERTRANILGGLAEKLKLFAIEGIQQITNITTIDISKLGTKKKKPMAIFILMPDEDRTFSPVINVMINSIFSQLYKTARKTNSRLENPVYCIFDEMANIGKIPNIKQRLGGMRGRRIYPMMIWQSLAQMKERYKDGYEDMLSQCDTQIYLGVNDSFTAKICSESLGNTTIKIQGMSKKGDTGIFTPDNKSESYSYQQRKLLMPEECRKFKNSKLILWQRAVNPLQLYKVQYKYWKKEICEKKEVEDLPKLIEQKNIRNKGIDVMGAIAIDEVKTKEKSKREKTDDDLSIEGIRSMMYDDGN